MSQQPEPYTTIRRRLGPLGLRLRLSDTLYIASRSLWAATLAFALILLVGHLTPIPHLLLWASAPLVLWVVAVVGYLLVRPLPLLRVARRVDTTLDLRERLSTALELHSAPADAPDAPDADEPPDTEDDQERRAELRALQQQDAATTAQVIQAGQLPLRFDRRAALLGLLPLVVGLALLWLPNPQNAILAEQEQVRAAIDEVVEDLEELEEQIAEDETLSPEERAELERQIAELQEELRQNPGNREEALAELSAAENELQQQLDPQTDARRAALEQMARNMENLSGEQPSQRPDLEQAAQNLEELAERLEDMSEEERQELAEQLAEQAARTAGGDQQTAQNLSDAAQSLSDGDAQQAAEELQQAAESVREAQGDIAEQDATQRTLSELQDGRQQVAQAGDQQQGQQQAGQQQGDQQGQQGDQQGQQGQQQGQQGQQQGDQQGDQQGQGGAQGDQQGQQGDQQGQQPGGGGASADNLGEGQSDTNAEVDPEQAGQQGSGDSAGNQSADTVYQPFDPSGEQGDREFIEGQQSEGGSVQRQQGDANLPGVNNPSVVPYEQVFPEYSESASEALDRGYIPPHLKDYVRDYFSQLEPSDGD